MVTMQQIADRCGVSRGTVDRALHHKEGVREEVADVAREDRVLRDGADDVADIGRRKCGGAADERGVGVRVRKNQIVGSQKEPSNEKKTN